MKAKQKTISAVAAVVMAVVAGLGVLMPGMVGAGEMEPSAAPSSDGTMIALDHLPPTWSRKLPASERFELVMGGEAVLDKETGLVWEQTVGTGIQTSWVIAGGRCRWLTETAGRKGWHLPTVDELSSLIDPSVPEQPGVSVLPTGHPFDIVALGIYWTSTLDEDGPLYAYVVPIASDDVTPVTSRPVDHEYYYWCVRGR